MTDADPVEGAGPGALADALLAADRSAQDAEDRLIVTGFRLDIDADSAGGEAQALLATFEPPEWEDGRRVDLVITAGDILLI